MERGAEMSGVLARLDEATLERLADDLARELLRLGLATGSAALLRYAAVRDRLADVEAEIDEEENVNAQDELRLFAAMKMVEIAVADDGVNVDAVITRTARTYSCDPLALSLLLLRKTWACQRARAQAEHEE